MKDSGGPYLAAAVVCERTLEEKDGVMSFIRIIDRIQITAHGPEVPDKIPTGQVQVMVVVSLKPGKARGRHSLSITAEKPSTERHKTAEIPVLFEGEDRGVNIVARTTLQVDQEGLYWFLIHLDGDQFLTKIPLRIVYQPMRTSSGS